MVPTYKRPEFLAVCLEAILTAEPTMAIHVFPDRGTNELEVCKQYAAVHHLTIQHAYHGNTFNMLMALKWAYDFGAQRVFVIEDDAIVEPSFFQWCRTALESKPDSFAACGWQFSPDQVVSEGPDISIPWYLSVCSCLPRKSLSQIVHHAVPEYFSDMGGYADKAFPTSFRKGTKHYEQDGLILRICESQAKSCVWPRKPKATHIGWRGYHMPEGKEPVGALEDRVELVKLAVKEPALLKRLMEGAEVPDMAHCEMCNKPLLSENKEARTICADCFHASRPSLAITSSFYYLPKESHV